MPTAKPDREPRPLTAEELKAKADSLPEDFPGDLRLRIHRALRWLWRAELECDNDPDAKFVFYWIAFNAAYARTLPNALDPDQTEVEAFEDFFRKLALVDGQRKAIHRYAFSEIPKTIVSLVSNRYVFWEFWRYHDSARAEHLNWQRNLEDSIRHTRSDIRSEDTGKVLTTVFDRLYTLRNQLVHGGATWNSSVNRKQVEDGAAIMAYTMPVFIDLMMDKPAIFNDGRPYYPVVGSKFDTSRLTGAWPLDRCIPPCRHADADGARVHPHR